MGACNSIPAPVPASDSELVEARAKVVKELEAARGEALAAHQAESLSRAEDLERKIAALAEEVQSPLLGAKLSTRNTRRFSAAQLAEARGTPSRWTQR